MRPGCPGTCAVPFLCDFYMTFPMAPPWLVLGPPCATPLKNPRIAPGSRVILPALLLTLDKYSSWRVGTVVPMIRSALRTTLCSLLRSDLVAELNQTVIEVQRTDSKMAD